MPPATKGQPLQNIMSLLIKKIIKISDQLCQSYLITGANRFYRRDYRVYTIIAPRLLLEWQFTPSVNRIRSVKRWYFNLITRHWMWCYALVMIRRKWHQNTCFSFMQKRMKGANGIGTDCDEVWKLSLNELKNWYCFVLIASKIIWSSYTHWVEEHRWSVNHQLRILQIAEICNSHLSRDNPCVCLYQVYLQQRGSL